nr:MAG TPA: hypothetical protein [Caudoviricetes sp.]
MSEAHCDLFTEFYRRRIAELQAALRAAKSEAEQDKIKRELDPYLKEIGKDEK